MSPTRYRRSGQRATRSSSPRWTTTPTSGRGSSPRERAGATVRWAEFDTDTGELPAERFDEVIEDRTRLVAVTAASNAIGSRPDVRAIADRAHAAGALVYVDGVHATPHVPTDMRGLGADLYVFSTYKLFGPHAGRARGRPGAPGAHLAGEARAGVRRRA